MKLGQVKPFWLNPPCLFRKSINRSPRTLSLRRSRVNKPEILSKWRVSPWRSRNSLDGQILEPTLQFKRIDKTQAFQSFPNPRNAFFNPGVFANASNHFNRLTNPLSPRWRRNASQLAPQPKLGLRSEWRIESH